MARVRGAAPSNTYTNQPRGNTSTQLYTRSSGSNNLSANQDSSASQNAVIESPPANTAITLYKHSSVAQTQNGGNSSGNATDSTPINRLATTIYKRGSGTASNPASSSISGSNQVIYSRTGATSINSSTVIDGGNHQTPASKTDALIAQMQNQATNYTSSTGNGGGNNGGNSGGGYQNTSGSSAGLSAEQLAAGIRQDLSGNTNGAPSTAISPLGYKTGDAITAKLVTRVVTAEGARVPVIARSSDGVLWIGSATYDSSLRMQVSFERAVKGDKEYSVTVTTFSTDEQPGLPAIVEDSAPNIVADSLRTGASGLTNYTKTYLENLGKPIIGNITSGGDVSMQTPQAPKYGTNLLESIGGNVASLLTLPPSNQTVIRTARVDKGTAVLLYYNVKW